MAWIKLHQTVFKHPKINRLSALMKWDARYSCGFMAELWCWALDYAEDGDLSKFTDEELAISFGFNTSVAPVLIKSLKTAGFLTNEKKIKNWNEYAGEFLKIRYRKKPIHKGNTRVTPVLHTTRQEETREDKKRQDNSTPPKPPKGDKPNPYYDNQDITKTLPKDNLKAKAKVKAKDNNNIYTAWQNSKIVTHKKITDGIRRKINIALKDYSEEQICKAIQNYSKILKDDNYFFNYTWGLEDFLSRGLRKFIDETKPFDNFRRDKYGNEPKEIAGNYSKPTPGKFAGLENRD